MQLAGAKHALQSETGGTEGQTCFRRVHLWYRDFGTFRRIHSKFIGLQH